MDTPKFMGLNITPRFAEALGRAQEKESRGQMTHTRSSTQDDKGWEQNLYEKSDIYRTTKDAITAPMRAIEGTLDPYSPQGVEEALGTAGMGLVGSMPGGASGPGSLGVIKKLTTLPEKELAAFENSLANSPYQKLLDSLHEQAFQGYKSGQLDFDQSVAIHENLLEKNKNTLKGLYKQWSDTQEVKPISKQDAEIKPFTKINTPIEELEAKVLQQTKELETTGYERLPGAAGKRDSDVQPSVLEKIMKKAPGLFKSNPSMLQKYESYLRNIKKLPEEEVDKEMLPLWQNYLNNSDAQPKDDKWDRIPEQRGMKKTTEVDTLLPTLEKLTAMIESMNKPKTVLRDKDGKIVGVA